MDWTLRPIGVVRSSLRALENAPRQASEGAPEARLEIDPAFADALQGIDVGDELIVLTWLHLADRDTPLLVHPRDDENIPLTGLFKTRSSSRPNPIGLHPVTVTWREGTILGVDALEAVDGTPIVDLKVPLTRRRAAPPSAPPPPAQPG
jgi:tRNA-Thr(GGU) m(6)t(6)A37 methyltransferase TsaA